MPGDSDCAVGPAGRHAPLSQEFHLLPRKTMHMRVGPPVDLDDLRDQPITAEVLDEATTRIIDAITGLLAHLRGPNPRATARLQGLESQPEERGSVMSKVAVMGSGSWGQGWA